MDLRDKVIVITGASSGFGELIARGCAERGARLALVARSGERLQRLADELGARAGRALALPADVSDDAQVRTMAEAVLAHFGHADVVVANAGFGVLDKLADAKLADLREMVDVNVYGVVSTVQAFLPGMLRQRSGQVVIMASQAGLIATARMGFYNATKHALVGLARTLMLELAGTGVRCALICPGVARTGFQQRADDAKYARSTRLSACTPEQVAAATLRAIERRTHGEVLVPGYVRALVAAAAVAPRLARLVLRLLG